MTRPRRHRGFVALFLILGTLATLVACVAVWLDQQALDTDNWEQTSSHLIANPAIRHAVGSYAVQQLFVQTDVRGTLSHVLPEPLVGPTVDELRRLGGHLANAILSKRSAVDTWRQANRQAQHQLLTILDQSGDQNRAVVLNLEPLLRDLIKALLGSTIVQALPGGGTQLFGTASPHAGQIVVLRPDQVQRASDVVNGIRGLSLVLPLAAVALFAAALLLAVGWRVAALGRVGLCLAGAGVLVLVARRLIESAAANYLVSDPTYRSAGRAVWLIGTSELRDAAVITLVVGLVVLIGSVVWRLATRVVRTA
ncbi:MAG: hypothetical protein WAK93_05800 [Solirubrobacteraceae bacterium]